MKLIKWMFGLPLYGDRGHVKFKIKIYLYNLDTVKVDMQSLKLHIKENH